MSNTDIQTFEFSDSEGDFISCMPMGKNWPVVYLIHNNKELYVGETNNAGKRIKEHIRNPARGKLKTVRILFDEEFNKSAVLDIEQTLIRLYNADGVFELQNMNYGQSANHNYYQREFYLGKMDDIWKQLMGMKLAKERLDSLVNKDLFKYSPYISLTDDQSDICYSVIDDMTDKMGKGKPGMSVIKGGAGTGKTIVAVKLISMLLNAMTYEQDAFIDSDAEREDLIMHNLRRFLKKNGSLKIGFVVPMTSMRGTLKKVFSANRKLLAGCKVIGPNDVIGGDYDVLFVDESHRLTRRSNITNYESFDTASKKLGLDPKSATQLDWIKGCSKYQVLFYDSNQSVKNSDITRKKFDEHIEGSLIHILTTQMRCEGGNDYTEYLTDVLECKNAKPTTIKNYDLRMFEDVDKMVSSIKKLDADLGLCRNVAGYSWEWISKDHSLEDIAEKHLEDILIGDHKYIWNRTLSGWILSDNAINEIGCIHTVQGFDLNYIGIIFGKEIDYDPDTNSMMIDRKSFFDTKVKANTDYEVLKTFIINTYKVLMTRGIKGCYIYCYNKNLREYLKKYFGVRP